MRPQILLVEDDPITRFVAREMMAHCGCETDIAPDGPSGVQMFKDNPGKYALILMDVHLPEMSGVEATAHIRATKAPHDPAIPIIAFTGDPAYHSRSTVLGHGMDDVVAKPTQEGALARIVTRYCASG